LYQDFTNRDTLLELVRFKSTREDGYTSLSDYKTRMKKLEATKDEALFEDITHILFEQAMLIEGVELKNPHEFTKRLNRVLGRAL